MAHSLCSQREHSRGRSKKRPQVEGSAISRFILNPFPDNLNRQKSAGNIFHLKQLSILPNVLGFKKQFNADACMIIVDLLLVLAKVQSFISS